MTHLLTTAETLENLATAMRKIMTEGERVILEQDGREVAALIPIEDLRLLEAMEDRIDVQLANEALEEMKRTGEKPTRLEDIAHELGIDLPKTQS